MELLKIVKAIQNGKGPDGESPQEIERIILEIMQPYNMHHVPSPEMEALVLENFFLALYQNQCVGASGYKMLDATTGKTTLLAVLPEYNKLGIGQALQDIRVETMKGLGATKIITNADRPESIRWYKKQGYQEIGKIKKLHSFGLETVDHWTTLLLLC